MRTTRSLKWSFVPIQGEVMTCVWNERQPSIPRTPKWPTCRVPSSRNEARKVGGHLLVSQSQDVISWGKAPSPEPSARGQAVTQTSNTE